jgi:hypothetical protein
MALPAFALDESTGSGGINDLLKSPDEGVKTLSSIDPLWKAVLFVVGIVIGGSVVLTIISLGVNQGRISWGGIFDKYKMVLNGRDYGVIVFIAFLGFLIMLSVFAFISKGNLF